MLLSRNKALLFKKLTEDEMKRIKSTLPALRAHMDGLIAARQLPTDGHLEGHRDAAAAAPAPPRPDVLHGLRHPIPGRVMADILADERCLRLAARLLRCPLRQLRLNEQVLIRTDTSTDAGGSAPNPPSLHIDWGFLREQYEATPRGTYFHMVTYLSTVQPGGGCFTIVPGSCARRRPPRVISDCHSAVQLNHFIRGFLSYSVAVLLK